MERYHVLEVIGEGSFGRVYKGRRKHSAQVVALKFIPKLGRSEKELRNLQREIEIMRGLHHPNIVQMLDSFETDKEVVVVTDYAEGELFQILEDDGSLPEEQVQAIAAQLVSALYYLHSHRILHRDMKPQNILLGKGGVIKLCDFGFARAMSIHTLVLTSIKGTPLYMAPELVQEQPYDHAADLWSMGCILYELLVGAPPFYTTSIFQLVSLIVSDPVRWPKSMSPPCKSFLQGLLIKDPCQRLSWPELLGHPFLAGHVTIIEDTEEQGIPNPFTSKLPPELQALKERQAHSLAPRRGQSKILRKARQRMAEETRRKQAKTESTGRQDPSGKGGPGPRPRAAPVDGPRTTQGPEPSRTEWEVDELPPMPGEHCITQDYEREFPGLGAPPPPGTGKAGRRGRRSIEAVALENEELDSDEEWQHLVEATEPSRLQLSAPLSLLGDPGFPPRLRARMDHVSQQVLEGMLEGASRLRPTLRVIGNLLSTRCDAARLYDLCRELELPRVLLGLAGQVLDSVGIMQQPWSITVLTDLVIVTTGYFTSDFNQERSVARGSLETFVEASHLFLALLPRLLCQPMDGERRLQQQSVMGFTLLCESMDGSCSSIATSFYTGLCAEHHLLLDTLLQGASGEWPIPAGSVKEAKTTQEQSEHLADIFMAALASACSIPLGRGGCWEAKKQVAQHVAQMLAETPQVLGQLLERLERPTCSLNGLKILYAACHVSQSLCRLLEMEPRVPGALAQLLKGEVPMPELVRGQAQEATLHLLSLLTLQLQAPPPGLDVVALEAGELFTHSAVVSLVSAAGFLLTQLCQHGVAVDLGREEATAALTNALTARAQLCLPPPLGAGLYDGLLFFLLELLAQEEGSGAWGFAGSELWDIMWHRVAAALGLARGEPEMESEMPRPGQPTPEPDWNLISPQGTLLFVNLALLVFTREPHLCLGQLAQASSLTLATLSKLLSPDFLLRLTQMQAGEDGDRGLVAAVVLQTCQLLCFPFALEVDEETLARVVEAASEAEIPAHLLQACCHHLPLPATELPLSLLCHLALRDERAVGQFVAMAVEPAVAFLSAILLGTHAQPTHQLLALLAQVARASPAHLPFLHDLLGGSDGTGQVLSRLLGHPEPLVRAGSCSLVGNLLRHKSGLPGGQAGPLERLLELLGDPDGAVRRAASFAVGNAAYQAGGLVQGLAQAVPCMVRLLGDPQARTRSNAASALGNLGRNSAKLADVLIQNKVPRLLLHRACHDSQPMVREAALIALRALSRQPGIRQVLVSLKASEKLGAASLDGFQASLSRSPRPASARHCEKLIHLLRPTHSA
ncbi:PREDICTED: serine/threonine-protein kinase 36 isoform X2 [Gavialis gangeticus]|uniref:serine/threonine-protein kinase 36 isoform X2 n=1 Tax=Gavialis gangeticus TaxID=94835 RepID=UPI00092E2CA5|nr:PREDICTED: serine/threonine-protein kinase 36 isoform X2 [Gavialis gangeticus]